jgi:F-type H+-transporting ATPase subunit epsilon
VTLHVELLMPDRELWSGEAGLVIAKTLDGDIGVQTDHSPVFGILAEGSLVRVLDVPGQETPGDALRAAVSGGFLSVADNRVSILATRAQLASEVDADTVRQDLDAAIAEAGSPAAAEESPEARYARAQLRAAGEQA